MPRVNNVGELRQALEGLDSDLPILLSKDAEGNAYRGLWEIEQCKSYGHEHEQYPVHPDDLDEYDSEYLTDVVVLWPS